MRPVPKSFLNEKLRYVLMMLAAVALLGGCKSVQDLTEAIRKPDLRIAGVDLEALSFTGARLRFDVEIANPNPIGIELSGFDYELQIEDEPFVMGEVDQKVRLAARGRSTVPFPVEIVFEELLKSVREVAEQEEADYRLEAGFFFDLPVLGRIRVPVSTSGSVPVVRRPGLKVAALRLEAITPAGAQLMLELELQNPNRFAVFLESLNYRLRVGGRDWVTGMRQEAARVPKNGKTRLAIPINLDFAALGGSVYQMIVGGESLRYELQATVVAGTSLAVLKRATLPFQLSGELRIQH
jgi:LEA14-like dessication related protein